MGAAGPGGWGFAGDDAVEEVVVGDLEAVADLASAEARAAKGECLGAQPFVAVLGGGFRAVHGGQSSRGAEIIAGKCCTLQQFG